RRAFAPPGARPDGKLGLPLYGGGGRPAQLDVETLRAETFWLRAPSLDRARAALARHPRAKRVELELDDYAGLDGGLLDGKPIVRAIARTVAQARALLSIDAFEVVVDLTRETAEWLLGLAAVPARLALRQPTYERLTEAAERDVELRDFFARFRHSVPVEGVPACVTGRAPRPRPRTLDTAMLTEGGRVEIFRYTKRYIVEHYTTKSLRCKTCVHDSACAGMHVNYVRAHGYAFMQPASAESALAGDGA